MAASVGRDARAAASVPLQRIRFVKDRLAVYNTKEEFLSSPVLLFSGERKMRSANHVT